MDLSVEVHTVAADEMESQIVIRKISGQTSPRFGLAYIIKFERKEVARSQNLWWKRIQAGGIEIIGISA